MYFSAIIIYTNSLNQRWIYNLITNTNHRFNTYLFTILYTYYYTSWSCIVHSDKCSWQINCSWTYLFLNFIKWKLHRFFTQLFGLFQPNIKYRSKIIFNYNNYCILWNQYNPKNIRFSRTNKSLCEPLFKM